MSQPRVLVVTLASGEAELEMSERAVMVQKGVNITRTLISGLPELEAHNKLLEEFRLNVKNYDLFVKVDADTVISFDDAFKTVYDVMISKSAACAEVPLLDYFTLTNIMGLNFWIPSRNDYVPSSDRLYCDRSIVRKGPFLSTRAFMHTHLIPIGLHCVCPNDKQSFHYGYHRGLKNRRNEESLTAANAQTHKDRARKLAVLGFTYAKKHQKLAHEYVAQEFNDLFLEAIRTFDEPLTEKSCTMGS